MCRLLFFIKAAIFALFFSEVNAEVVNELLLSNKVIFSDQSRREFMQLVRECIGSIHKNPVGQRLLRIIKDRIAKTEAIDNLVIEETTGNENQHTAFYHGIDFYQDPIILDTSNLRQKINGKLHLYINLDDTVNCYIPSKRSVELFSESECLYKPSNLDGNKLMQTAYYRVATIYSPFYITIAHEFIHLKHFLDDCLQIPGIKIPCGYAALITEYGHVEKYIKNSSEIGEELKRCPELEEFDMFSNVPNIRSLNMLRRVIPWDNFEERRTVCGPDIDGISEMTLRLAENLPIRYIYQGNRCFFEDASVARRIIQSNIDACNDKFGLSISIDNVLRGLPDWMQNFQKEKVLIIVL